LRRNQFRVVSNSPEERSSRWREKQGTIAKARQRDARGDQETESRSSIRATGGSLRNQGALTAKGMAERVWEVRAQARQLRCNSAVTSSCDPAPNPGLRKVGQKGRSLAREIAPSLFVLHIPGKALRSHRHRQARGERADPSLRVRHLESSLFLRIAK
jgi:hypothetical protein